MFQPRLKIILIHLYFHASFKMAVGVAVTLQTCILQLNVGDVVEIMIAILLQKTQSFLLRLQTII